MERSRRAHAARPEPERAVDAPLGAARPISWGVCEVPGWGLQLPPERVLAEMAQLGLARHRARPAGLAAARRRAARAELDRHGLRLVGGFVPLVVHEAGARRRRARRPTRAAAQLAAAGADVFVARARRRPRLVAAAARSTTAGGSAPASTCARSPTSSPREGLEPRRCTRTSARWSRPPPTSSGARAHRRRLVLRHRPPADRRRRPRRLRPRPRRRGSATSTSRTSTRASRSASAPARCRSSQATQAGLFRPLGEGDAGIDEVVRLLERHGYERWLVLEQDIAITGHGAPGRRRSCPRCARRASSSCPHGLRRERGCPTDEATRSPGCSWPSSRSRALVVAACGGRQQDDSGSPRGIAASTATASTRRRAAA